MAFVRQCSVSYLFIVYKIQLNMCSSFHFVSFVFCSFVIQRFSSQERENSVKKPSCLPVVSYGREDSQLPISRSSSNLIRNWSAAPVPDHKCKFHME